MNDNNILQFVENNRVFARKMNLEVSSDGKTVIFGRKRTFTLLFSVLMYIIIIASLLMICGALANVKTWVIIPIFLFIILLCVFLVRKNTRTILVDMSEKRVCITGKLQKQFVFSWVNYLGVETLFSIMDFPEQFLIKFQDGPKVLKFKLANVTPVLHKYVPENYDAIKSLWECIESDMLSVEYIDN